MRPKYATIKVPQAFADRIIDIAIQKQGTYRTVSEFVIESTRHELD
jgi:hypothetical protein